jgi:hypothetical protein
MRIADSSRGAQRRPPRYCTDALGLADEVETGRRMLFVAENKFTAAIAGTVQVVFVWQENQPHRAEIAKMLVQRTARRAIVRHHRILQTPAKTMSSILAAIAYGRQCQLGRRL